MAACRFSQRVGSGAYRQVVTSNAPATVVLVTGPPATGKSTLAEVAAAALGASVLAWDWAMAALTPFPEIQDALASMDRQRHRSVGWALLWQIGRAQLRRGQSVVLDGVARVDEIAGTRLLAAQYDARCLVIATSCSNSVIHRSRVEGRERGIPGWHELDWEHVADVTSKWVPPPDADIAFDAADDLDANKQNITRLLMGQT
jgi:hypothetical protein